ncbi:MAG: ShET2/EspL2 family type III secretion system effector toxin, partial [Burkholderiales bacterium]
MIYQPLNIKMHNKMHKLESEKRKFQEIKTNTLRYFSKNGNPAIGLNGQVDNAKGGKILCGDLAFEFLRQHKTYHAEFSSKESLEKIPFLVENLIYEHHLLFKADKNYLFSKEKFGLCLSKVCESLQQDNKKILNIYFASTSHAMAIRVEHKQYEFANGKVENNFIIKFYDPNITTLHTRIVCESISDIAKLEIADLLPNKRIKDYNFSAEGSVGIFGVYNEINDFNSQINHPQDLNTNFLINKTKALHFLFKYNAKATLIETVKLILKDKFLNNTQKCDLLQAHTKLASNTFSGLYFTIEQKYIELMTAFMHIVLNSTLPRKNKLEIITAKTYISNTSKFISGLYKALNKGYTEVVIE